jgi:hypothetical protein
MNAVLHSIRLTSNTWVDAIQTLNSTLTFTGDLGTESLFSRFHGDARLFYGAWISEDGGEQGQEEEGVQKVPAGPEGDLLFDFKEAGLVECRLEPEGVVADNTEA